MVEVGKRRLQLKQIMRLFFTIALSVLFSKQIYAQQLNNLYYDNRLAIMFGSIEEYNDSYYVSGVTTFAITDTTYYTKALFGKVNEDGSLHYIIGIFDSLNHHYSIFMNCLKKTADGNFIATGDINDSIPKAFLLKIDTDGNVLLWHEYTYPNVNLFHGHDVIEMEGAGYLIAINANFTNGNSETIIIRTDTLGDTLNVKDYGFAYTEFPWLIRPMLNGNFMIGAVTYSYNWARTWMLELDSMGNYVNQWIDTSLNNYYPLGMQQTADSGWIITRQHIALNIPNYQAYNASIVKLDKGFNKQWEYFLGDSSDVTGFYDVEILLDGKYIVCGTTPIWGSDSAHRFGWIVKFDTDGTKLWDRKYVAYERFGTQSFLYDIDVLPNGDLLACGELRFSFNVGITPAQQGWILRTDSNGCEIENCLVGIEEPRTKPQDASQIQIQPNPANSYVQIQTENGMISGEIKLYDVAGRLVLQKRIETEQMNLDITPLGKGLYIVTAEKGTKQARGKLVVE